MDDDKPVWVGAVGPFNPGPNWEIKGTGDFNGDGDDDILWQGSDGAPAVWMMDGAHVDWLGTVGPFNPGPNWEIKGTGDFNGDGKDDILWQGSDGTPAVWMMDGAHVDWLGTVGPFNPGPRTGRSRAPVISTAMAGPIFCGRAATARRQSGSWTATEPSRSASRARSIQGADWEIKGTDDFNSDGRSDILWQGSNGTPAIWLRMDGLSATDVAGLPNLGADWHIIA